MTLKNVHQFIKQMLCVSLAVLAVVLGVVTSLPDSALAINEPGRVEMNRAERELDSKTQGGTSDRIEGNLKKNAGRVQQQFGDSTRGNAREMEGRTQEAMGGARQKAEDIGEDIQDKSSSFVDSVRDFFD